MTRSKWRVLIADDEPAARLGVRQLLTGFRDFAVAGECRNGNEVLAALDAADPHVLFLDVQMPGIDGFEVLRRRTPGKLPAVVFLTAFDEFAVRAFEAQALDYLVKPVSEARFAATMARLAKHLKPGSPPVQDEQLVVTTPRGLAVVSVDDIEWIEAEDNYARVWTRNGRSQLLRQSLNELEPRVRARGFIRVHRQALVPIAGVRELQRTSAGLVAILAGGARVTVSRRRRAQVAAAVKKHSGI